ncbi:formin-1-like [Apodemus sylvaticus]|uniref:formin-1-like n=1 Tax=Apodemus sylvaticus TaxID=10129 RepID=UPI002242EBF4|nr:formin-1-like [Apodemus sylvaticus]
MEGTHCTLQLHNPITELCYISFYLPKGEVRGFSYKGTVTLDRSNNAFHNCYQVREGPDITSLSQQPNEHPGDIFFKQTPTKNILTELYKLAAEKERLLDSLLRSDNILGISMGNQEGKLQELSVSLATRDDHFQSAGNWRRELPGSSLIRRSTQENKKPRRSGRRRESLEELREKRTRRKGRGCQESVFQMGKDQVCSGSSLSPGARPNLRLLEERGNLVPQGTFTSSLKRRRESCPANILRTPDADLGFRNSRRTSEDPDLEGPLSPDSSPAEVGVANVGGQLKRSHQQEPPQPNLSESHVKHPGAERGGSRTRKSKSLERTCSKKPVSKVVTKVQELSAPVKRIVRAHHDGKGRVAFSPDTQTESISKADFLTLPGGEAETHSSRRLVEEQGGIKLLWSSSTERTSLTKEPASTEAAVNKVLRKVIESEKLDEATEGKRLGFSRSTRATHTFPESRSQRKAGLPHSGHKFLLLDLPHTVGPDSLQPKCDERKPSPQAPTALGMVFNNSSPQSSAHKRLSPVPSPLSPRCPSPQQHHRILLLPPLPSEGEAVFNECPSKKNGGVLSSGFPSADTLEPSSSTKVTETKGASPTSLRASQTWLVPEETSEKSLGLEKVPAPPQHQLLSGSPPFSTIGACYRYNPRYGQPISVSKVWKCRHRQSVTPDEDSVVNEQKPPHMGWHPGLWSIEKSEDTNFLVLPLKAFPATTPMSRQQKTFPIRTEGLGSWDTEPDHPVHFRSMKRKRRQVEANYTWISTYCCYISVQVTEQQRWEAMPFVQERACRCQACMEPESQNHA